MDRRETALLRHDFVEEVDERLSALVETVDARVEAF